MKKTAVFFIIFLLLASPCPAADPVIAIDILLEPDNTMVEQARLDNARLRENYPESFALDATHTPHITVLQCYVRPGDLDKVISTVEQVVRERRPEGMELSATGYYYMPWEGLGLAGITIAPTPMLFEYQRAIIDAVRPLMIQNGTATAFVPNEDGSGIGQTTVDDIETYIPRHSGEHYRPHVTIGLAKEDFLRRMIAAPYTSFSFKVRSGGIYHLGNFGTARKKLWGSESLATSSESGQKILLVRDLPPAGKLPDHFRTMEMLSAALQEAKSPVSIQGLDSLRASGSAEPWETAFPVLKERFGENLILIDLRQESHGFLNGAPVTWYLPPGDWINLGKTRDETLEDEKERLARLVREKAALVHEDNWIPQKIQGFGKTEKVLSVTSEGELARRYGIRHFRLTVPDHMRPSDEDVDRFITFVRGLREKDWLHFHCHAGMGRTTTFLIMYDMLQNADRVSLEDIVARQAAAGPRYNVFRDESGAPWEKVFGERAAFVRKFYEYAKAFRVGSKENWTEWLKKTAEKQEIGAAVNG